ncbi:hypothetical protein P7C70_g6959, partial [Phenoliferia sp. Uapishka_3]
MALKLIEKRYRQGELRTCKGFGAVSKLPVEIWGLITVELYATTLEDALADWLAEMRCDDCKEDGERRLRRRKAKARAGAKDHALPIYDWTAWEYPDCDECMEFFDEVHCDLDSDSLTKYSGWRDILLEHGVALASELTSGQEEDFYPVTDAQVPIRLIDKSSSASDTALNAELSHFSGRHRQTQHAMISRETLTTPLEDRPFTTLVERYRLRVVESSSINIPGRPAQPPSDSTEVVSAGDCEVAGPAKVVQGAQWRLWTTVCSCD